MNIIFLDFDGVINTKHFTTKDEIEFKIKIVAEIAKKFNCKIVIEASAKNGMNEQTLEIKKERINFIINTLNKYGVECIGRTPSIKRFKSENAIIPIWKESEIKLYLLEHPEVEHFCIIDDNDFKDLETLSSYLVKTNYNDFLNYQNEGILPYHASQVEEILTKENIYNINTYNDNDLLKDILMNDYLERYEKYIFKIIPELIKEKDFPQNNDWHSFDVWHHTIHAVESGPKNYEDRLILLLHDIGKPISFWDDENGVRHFPQHADESAKIAKPIFQRLGFENEKIEEMIKIIKNHSTAINIEDITKDNYKYYKRLLTIQKSDVSAYEEKHAEKMYNELSIKEEKIRSLF